MIKLPMAILQIIVYVTIYYYRIRVCVWGVCFQQSIHLKVVKNVGKHCYVPYHRN